MNLKVVSWSYDNKGVKNVIWSINKQKLGFGVYKYIIYIVIII